MRGYRLWLVIVLAIAGITGWMSLAGDTKIDFLGIERDIKVVQGLDLQGGSRVLLEAAPGTDYNDDTMRTAARLVEQRVNGLGVTEAVVQRQEGSGRIIVELPGVRRQEVAFDAIKSTGLLEFVDFSAISSAQYPEGACLLTDEQVRITESRLTEGAEAPSYSDYTCASETPGQPDDVAILQNGQPFKTVMTGSGLADAATTLDQYGVNPVVSFALKSNGERVDDFVNYVANNANRPLAIVLDGRLISYPTIQSDLASSAAAGTMDGGIISGNFTRDEADVLAAQLKYGALPIPMDIIAFDTIGPTLGKVSVERSIRAGFIGVLTILLFMLIYYRVPGIAADLALLLFTAINFALFKFIPVTMTLPAIIGFLISIGTAVDGNILIFERIKEEIRAGRSMERAIDAGFDRAWTSIRDSNISTIIITFILYFFGSTFGASAVQGFAVTLGLGLVINLFTAVIVTRTILHTIVLLFGNTLRAHMRLLGA